MHMLCVQLLLLQSWSAEHQHAHALCTAPPAAELISRPSTSICSVYSSSCCKADQPTINMHMVCGGFVRTCQGALNAGGFVRTCQEALTADGFVNTDQEALNAGGFVRTCQEALNADGFVEQQNNCSLHNKLILIIISIIIVLKYFKMLLCWSALIYKAWQSEWHFISILRHIISIIQIQITIVSLPMQQFIKINSLNCLFEWKIGAIWTQMFGGCPWVHKHNISYMTCILFLIILSTLFEYDYNHLPKSDFFS